MRAFGDRTEVRIDALATEAAARALVETTDVLNVAAPLHLSAPAPLFSSLVLGGSGDGPADDGRFEAREWFTVTARARVLVVPDASGFGSAGAGGAMDTIAWAAAAAGVPSLVFGRWPAESFDTRALAAAFHTELARGRTPDRAWRTAVLAIRKTHGLAPAAWAGLRFVGTLSGAVVRDRE